MNRSAISTAETPALSTLYQLDQIQQFESQEPPLPELDSKEQRCLFARHIEDLCDCI